MQTGEHVVAVPDLGDFDEVEIIEILVEPGARIASGASIVTLESEKAAMELPAPAAGVVKALHVALGDKVVAGAPLLTLETSGQVPGQAPEQPSEQRPEQPSEPMPERMAPGQAGAPRPPAADAGRETVRDAPSPQEAASIRAGPSVRRFARELGVDVSAVRGSGPKGRIVEQDIKDFVRKSMHSPVPPSFSSPSPAARGGDYSRFGDVEVIEQSRIQSVVAERVRRAWCNVPHVTQHDEADVTDLEELRNSSRRPAGQADRDVKPTLLAFLVKALALSLRDFPRFNTAFDDDGRLIQKHYCHVGIAMDVADGLFVPVIRDADRKDVFVIARAIRALATRARDGKLAPADLQGGCITISNQGGIGGRAFTPIINAPEVAILGVSRARVAPLWNGEAFVPRLMLPLDLSYDHRVVNGADAARFLDGYRRLLSEARRLLPDTR